MSRHARPFGSFTGPTGGAYPPLTDRQDTSKTQPLFEGMAWSVLIKIATFGPRGATSRANSSGLMGKLKCSLVGGIHSSRLPSRCPRSAHTYRLASVVLCCWTLCLLCLTQTCKRSRAGASSQTPLGTSIPKMDSLHRHIDVSFQNVTWAHVVGPSRQTQPSAIPWFRQAIRPGGWTETRFSSRTRLVAVPVHGEQPGLLSINNDTAFVPDHFSSEQNWAQGLHPALHRPDGYGT
jgi:hypothetical protein